MNTIFFTSDEHYGHENVIKFCNRPFSNTIEMRDGLIARHNERVPEKGAIVYHVGDMFWRTVTPVEALWILNRLHGTHYFIWGNHDEVIEHNENVRKKFVWCKDIAQVFIGKGIPKIVLCHYAMRVWRNSHNGAWHLYGHTHGVMRENNSLSFDVGVDANNYYPVSLEEVAVRMWMKQGEKSWREVIQDQALRQRICQEHQ